MNRKVKSIIATLLLSSTLVTACGNSNSKENGLNNESESVNATNEEVSKEETPKGDVEEFNTLVEDINLARESVFDNAPVIKDEYINWFEEEEDDGVFTDELIAAYSQYRNSFMLGKGVVGNIDVKYDNNKMLTYDEANEDVNTLFDLFRYTYGAYGYFGGDEVFNVAKENILKELEGHESIKNSDFHNILVSNLSFVKDSHFAINNEFPGIGDMEVYYIGSDEFLKDGKGYFKELDGEQKYISEINGEKDIEKYMKQSINEEGKLIYRIAVLRKMDTNRGVVVPVKYDGNEENITLAMMEVMPKSRVIFEYRVQDGIPIAKLGAMYDKVNGKGTQEEFSNSAQEMKKYPVSILDLRGNEGGFEKAGLKWVEEYSEGRGELRVAKVTVYSDLRTRMMNIDDVPPFGYVQNESSIPNVRTNDNLLFVLIDKMCTSASELFIEELMNIENVIFVGTNTMGATLNNGAIYFLENSQIHVGIGDTLYLTPYGEDFELRGFQPDILFESDDALGGVLNLINYYGLNKNSNQE